MIASIKDIFGGKLEQEVMDTVVILPHLVRSKNTGTITLPLNTEWKDFEYIEIGLGGHNYSVTCSTSTIDNIAILERPTSWTYNLSYRNLANWALDLELTATSATTASWLGTCSNSLETAWPLYMVGYKRRIASVGLDELMSSIGLPNLIANCDLTSNKINQRGFDGNWGGLAVGAYGYDQWVKVSNTHMGYVIEDGKYRPNSVHTLTINDVVIKEVRSPSSGHFVIAIPFSTTGVYDLYCGRFKRPWHPSKNALVECARYYEKVYLDTTGVAYYNEDCRGTVIPMLAQKRAKPTLGRVTVSIFAVSPAGNGVNLSGSLYNWLYYPTHMSAANLGNAANIAIAIGGSTGTVFSFSCRETNPMLVDCAIPWAELSNKIIYAA